MISKTIILPWCNIFVFLDHLKITILHGGCNPVVFCVGGQNIWFEIDSNKWSIHNVFPCIHHWNHNWQNILSISLKHLDIVLKMMSYLMITITVFSCSTHHLCWKQGSLIISNNAMSSLCAVTPINSWRNWSFQSTIYEACFSQIQLIHVLSSVFKINSKLRTWIIIPH